jgi:uncharacterized protein HemX
MTIRPTLHPDPVVNAPTHDRPADAARSTRLRRAMRARLRGDRGEGVISAAIAVLIMAFLGAAMWIGFQQMWQTTESTTNDKISQIGNQ